MSNAQNSSTKKPFFDLEERTFDFAKNVRVFTKKLPRTIENREDIKQLVRASGSQGANYIEANEALSKKDFLMRIKISRKEAKESTYFLKLVDYENDQNLKEERNSLIKESIELTKIFGAIVTKSQ